MSQLSHFDKDGNARMVDVSEKSVTHRVAIAAGSVILSPETFSLVQSGNMKKGDVLTVAQLAGIMGAKQTSSLIPLCHPLFLSGIKVLITPNSQSHSLDIEATVSTEGTTGVEMEALTAVSVAALTVYDMCKAVQRDITITNIRLVSKSGGKSGDYIRGQ